MHLLVHILSIIFVFSEHVEENFESMPARALYAVPKPTPLIVSLFLQKTSTIIKFLIEFAETF
jgi:ABC-type arginine/histidine transport system permease subunit